MTRATILGLLSVHLAWQEKSGAPQRITGRCVDLSSEGMQIEIRDRLNTGTDRLVAAMNSAGWAILWSGTVGATKCDTGRAAFRHRFPAGRSCAAKILARVLNRRVRQA